MLILLWPLWLLPATVAEWSSCHRALGIYYLFLHRKCLLTPDLGEWLSHQLMAWFRTFRILEEGQWEECKHLYLFFPLKPGKSTWQKQNLSPLLCVCSLKFPFFFSPGSSPCPAPHPPSPSSSSSHICGFICDLWYQWNLWALEPDCPCPQLSGSTDSLYTLGKSFDCFVLQAHLW